jgi:L-seryl-tRNA(Ser) seleniumtransferase
VTRVSVCGRFLVDKVLQSVSDMGIPRPIVVDVVRDELEELRRQKSIPEVGLIVAHVRARLQDVYASRIRPVINGTGILVHTTFGRAPLGPAAVSALSVIGSNYNNLEYSLTDGARGGRGAYLERGLALLCGAEAATVVNNNAAALVLILRHFCQPSCRCRDFSWRTNCRSAGFSDPEILEASGAP